MSKSGLFLHFGSKEKLELAVVEQALVQFLDHFLKPAEDDKLTGIERLWSLCDAWLEFVEHGPLPGGYLFTGVFFQTAKQNGPITRFIRGAVRNWIDALEEAAKQARADEEIKTDIDAQEVAFELNGLLLGAQWSRLMTGRDYTNARDAILSKFRSLVAEEIPEKAFRSAKAWKAYLANRDGHPDK
jgi:AcrR family transcriptional regulator